MGCVVWVGISNKNSNIPLNKESITGKIISDIESNFKYIKFIKMNLVDFTPIDKNGKIRYPTTKEIDDSFCELENKLNKTQPDVIFMLGRLVTETFNRKWKFTGTVEIPIYHPSYIYVYKRKELEKYINDVSNILKNKFNTEVLK